MCTTRTWDVDVTVQQIRELALAGCDIIRVACPGIRDADALASIVQQSPIPVVADIHFQHRFIFKAIEAGCGAVRVNPGNILQLDDKLTEIVAAAKMHGTPLRIGINAGSLDAEVLAKYGGKATAEALVEAALKEAREFERAGFEDFAISVKHHDPMTTIDAYRLLSSKGNWPLHLGVTEAGPEFQGTIKSATAFGALLAEGIGDTIRVSLSADPVQEVKVGLEILMALGLRQRKLEIISCPTCGRVEADVIDLAAKVQNALEGRPELEKKPLRVAVMGCIVNGPGEAREADVGVAGGQGKGQIFVKGEVIDTVEADQIIPRLMQEIDHIFSV
jgi:(E)-4-hydroxy-3-methylbut-2-enyl-diphosphate synthase